MEHALISNSENANDSSNVRDHPDDSEGSDDEGKKDNGGDGKKSPEKPKKDPALGKAWKNNLPRILPEGTLVNKNVRNYHPSVAELVGPLYHYPSEIDLGVLKVACHLCGLDYSTIGPVEKRKHMQFCTNYIYPIFRQLQEDEDDTELSVQIEEKVKEKENVEFAAEDEIAEPDVEIETSTPKPLDLPTDDEPIAPESPKITPSPKKDNQEQVTPPDQITKDDGTLSFTQQKRIQAKPTKPKSTPYVPPSQRSIKGSQKLEDEATKIEGFRARYLSSSLGNHEDPDEPWFLLKPTRADLVDQGYVNALADKTTSSIMWRRRNHQLVPQIGARYWKIENGARVPTTFTDAKADGRMCCPRCGTHIDKLNKVLDSAPAIHCVLC